MERICRLLSNALTPYQAQLEEADSNGHRVLTLLDREGKTVLRRAVSCRQLEDRRLLVDLVDGLHRDLQVAEGRLQPCVIAALHTASPLQGTFA